MQLQTERSYADRFQTTLHNLQGRHLFGNEQYLLPFVQSIGDDVRNRLRFAGSRRTVQNEAFVVNGRTNSFKLRRVGPDRQYNLPRRISLVQIDTLRGSRFYCPLYLARDETCHDFISAEFVGVIMDVVPHDELAEREIADNGLLLNVPSLLRHNGPTNYIENSENIHTASIPRQWIDAPNLNTKILPQHLQQCDVQHGLFIPAPNYIPFSCRFADNLNGYQ